MALTKLPEVLPFPAILAAWVISLGATCGVFWKLFDWLEQTASDAAREGLVEWLLRSGGSTWGETFVAMFEGVFGKRHLSVRCVWRSIVASCTALLCVTPIVAARRPVEAAVHWDMVVQSPTLIVWFSALVLLTNVTGDYISLWETRVLLRFVRRCTPRQAQLLLLLDVALTTCIFILLLWLSQEGLLQAMGAYVRSIDVTTISVYGVTYGISVASLSGFPLFALLLSTYVASGWLFVIAMSRLIVVRSLRAAPRILSVERQPFRSLGTASVLVVTATYIAVTLVAMIWSRW